MDGYRYIMKTSNTLYEHQHGDYVALGAKRVGEFNITLKFALAEHEREFKRVNRFKKPQ